VLTVQTSTTAAPGGYSLRVTGSSAGKMSSATGRLDVVEPGAPGIALGCAETTQSAFAGTPAVWDVGVAGIGAMRSDVTLSVAGKLPAGAKVTWVVTAPDGVTESGSASSTVAVALGGRARLMVTVAGSQESTRFPLLLVGRSLDQRTTLPLTLRVVKARQLATTIAVARSTTPVKYGGTVRFSATVKSGGQPAEGAVVTLWRSSNGGVTWSKDAEATWSAASRTYSATSKALTANTLFTMRSSGTTDSLPVMSAPAVATSKAYLGTPVTPKSVRKGAWFTTSGILKPYHGGTTKLYFYRRVGSSWRYYKYVSAKNAAYKGNTRYSYRLKLATKGTWSVVAKHSDSSHAATSSPRRSFTVK
jgi:hypothetical protein